MKAKDVITGIALCVIIFISTLYLPLLGFFISLLLPQPVLFYRLKHGRTAGLVIICVTVGIIVSITGSLTIDTLFYGSLLAVGFFLGENLENQVSIEKTIIYSTLETIGICLAIFAAYTVLTNTGFFSSVSHYVSKNLELTLQLYSDIGLSEEKIGVLSNAFQKIQYVLVRILPGLITVILALVAWINTLLIKRILKKDGVMLSWLGILNRWQSPEKLVWVVIITGGFLFVPSESVKLISLNLLILLMLIYFFQGIAIISFLFEKKGFPLALRLLIYTLIVIQQIFVLLVIGLGFFDTWLNFRKIDTVGNSKT